MPKHIWQDVPYADWKTDPGSTGDDPSRVVGTGPFKFVSIDVSNGATTFDRNPDYYAQVPNLDKMILQTWPDFTSTVEALRSGAIDVILGQLPPADADSLKYDPDFVVAVYDSNAFYFLATNMDPAKTTLFEDVRTRQALAFALDRQSVVDNLLLGYGEVAEGSQPKLSIAYAPDQITTHYTYDVDKAKSLLAEAGWKDEDGDGTLELDGQKFSFSLIYGAGEAFWDQLAAYIQEAYAEIGVEVTLESVDFSTVLLPILVGTPPTYDYEMLGTSFGYDFSGDQSSMFGTDGYEVGFNFMKYSNPEVDQLYADASVMLDPAKRADLLVEATDLVNEDIPMNVLIFLKSMTAYTSRLKNYAPNYTGGIFWSIPYAWMSES
jgi:peptide/nickel transport system substrate-binding protein